MRLCFVAAAVVCSFAACTGVPNYSYYSVYRVGESTDLRGQDAEPAHIAEVNTGSLSRSGDYYDRPLRLLKAPLPTMSQEDTNDRIVGEVTLEIFFAENGLPEKIRVVRSTKQSLTDVAVQAAQKWQASPATRAGKPVKFRVQQSFGFRGEP